MAKAPVQIKTTGLEGQVAEEFGEAMEKAAATRAGSKPPQPHITTGATAEPRPTNVRPDRRIPKVAPAKPDFLD